MGTDERPLTAQIVELDSHPFDEAIQRRIGNLELPEDPKFANAKSEFSALSSADQRGLNKAIDYWMQGHNKDNRHHGWGPKQHDGEATNCWVFKHTNAGLRIYGFVVAPFADLRAKVCALVHLTTKFQDATERPILRRIEGMLKRADVKTAVEQFWLCRINDEEEIDETE